MTKNENRKKMTGIGIKPVGAGVALGAITITLILFIGALLISGEKVPVSFESAIIALAALTGSLIGGLFAGKRNKGSFVLTGLTVGLVLFCIRMIVSAFSSDGQFFDSTAVNVLIFLLAGGFFGGLMAGKKRRRHKK